MIPDNMEKEVPIFKSMIRKRVPAYWESFTSPRPDASGNDADATLTPAAGTGTFRPETVLFDPEYKILRWTEEFSINIQERALFSDEYVGELLPYCG